MSFADCVARAKEDGHIDAQRASAAQSLWEELRDRYAEQGRPDDVAAALAAEDVKLAMAKEAGDKRHVYLAQLRVMRKLEAEVANSPDISTLGTSKIEYMDHRQNRGATLVAQSNALRRLFNGMMGDFFKETRRGLVKESKNPMRLENVAREVFGESTGDALARSYAEAWRKTSEEARRMANEAGALYGKLDDWNMPQRHNSMAITKAGFDRWFNEIDGRINWSRIEDHRTGKPMAPEGETPPLARRQEILREVYDNIVFRKETQEAVYGRPQGQSIVKRSAQHRVLHFKSADDWMAYNRAFGSGTVLSAMSHHLNKMADEITTLRELGPSPRLGLDYQRQLAEKAARERGDTKLLDKVKGNFAHAEKMLLLRQGGAGPENLAQAYTARFFSTVRHVLSGAMLDRSIIAQFSDTNSMRMAAKTVGMNPANTITRHMRLMTSGVSRDQALRMGWVADTMADPGLALSRWQQEFPPSYLAERISSGVLRAQGMMLWTDQARIAFQMEMAGYFAANAGRGLDQVDAPLRKLLADKGITAEEWTAFTDATTLHRAGNGATFASPLWWRQNTAMDPAKADDLFLRLQSIVEEQTEFAVPTGSLYARAHVPFEMMPAGSIGYEIGKSALMVKSFAMTFTTNQVSRIMAQPTGWSRATYAMDMVAGTAVMGALSLQVANLINGRDLQDMSAKDFWPQAILRGGGFGIIGDLISAGETKWGGGLGSYASGPVWQLAGDTYNLTVGNMVELLNGDDTKAGREFVKYLKRYTPGADHPAIGLAMDRLLWSSLQRVLDPEAGQAMRQAAQRTKAQYGSSGWWLPGEAAPRRAPDLARALGL